MPRMFDILRGKAEPPEPEENSQDNGREEKKSGEKLKKQEEVSVSFPKQIHRVEEKKPQPSETLEVPEKIIEAVKRKNIDSLEIAQEKYSHALKVIRIILKKLSANEPLENCIDEVYHTVGMFTDQLILGNNLLELVIKDEARDDYLPNHIVNVCILSLAIGLQLRLNKSKLHVLGMAAFLHDIGLSGMRAIVDQPRDLTPDEIAEVKQHVKKGIELVRKMNNRYHGIIEVIEQHHERADGSGYPMNLRHGQINEFARIIALIDTYESMTHWRHYREGKIPHLALKEIVSLFKNNFDPEVIKALIDKISIYPIGSYVKLSNGDIAKVITANSESPLRPLVLSMFDVYKNPVPEPKTIDLSQNTAVYIKEPVSLGS